MFYGELRRPFVIGNSYVVEELVCATRILRSVSYKPVTLSNPRFAKRLLVGWLGLKINSENYLYVKSILSGESACEETFQQNKRRAVLRLKTIRYELL